MNSHSTPETLESLIQELCNLTDPNHYLFKTIDWPEWTAKVRGLYLEIETLKTKQHDTSSITIKDIIAQRNGQDQLYHGAVQGNCVFNQRLPSGHEVWQEIAHTTVTRSPCAFGGRHDCKCLLKGIKCGLEY